MDDFFTKFHDMKYATIFLILAMAYACAADHAAPDLITANDSSHEVVEVVMWDEKGQNNFGVALVPRRLAFEYSYLGFYEGKTPPPGTDYDILAIPMKGGGEVYMLAIK